MREEVATWGFEAGSGDPPSVQHKVLKWTDYPIAQRILGPVPEISTLRSREYVVQCQPCRISGGLKEVY